MKKPYTVRLDESLLNEIQATADKLGVTVTAIFEQALISFLTAPNIGNEPNDILNRLERLEAVVLHHKPIKQTEIPENHEAFPDLLTVEQIAALTGYRIATISGKLSRNNISAVKQAGGNRKGLYEKDLVLERIGMNPKPG